MNQDKIKELRARIERDTQELAQLEAERPPEPPEGTVIQFINADGEAAVAVNTGDWGWYVMITVFPAPRTCVRDWADLLEEMNPLVPYTIATGWKSSGSPESNAQATAEPAPVLYWVELLNDHSGDWAMSWRVLAGHRLRVPAVFTDMTQANEYRAEAAKNNPGRQYRVAYYAQGDES